MTPTAASVTMSELRRRRHGWKCACLCKGIVTEGKESIDQNSLPSLEDSSSHAGTLLHGCMKLYGKLETYSLCHNCHGCEGDRGRCIRSWEGFRKDELLSHSFVGLLQNLQVPDTSPRQWPGVLGRTSEIAPTPQILAVTLWRWEVSWSLLCQQERMGLQVLTS